MLLVAACLVTFGSSGWALKKFFVVPKEGLPKAMRALELVGTPAVFVNLWALATQPIQPPAALVGLALFALGSSIFWWALKTNRRNPLNIAFTESQPSHFVSEGPYRYVRHPFYASYIFAWFAGPVATQIWWLFLPAILFIPVYYRAARMEEGYFSKSPLADKYRAYRKRTGMFLPRLFPR